MMSRRKASAAWRRGLEKRTWQAGGFAGIGGPTHLKLAVVISPLRDIRGVPHLGLDARAHVALGVGDGTLA